MMLKSLVLVAGFLFSGLATALPFGVEGRFSLGLSLNDGEELDVESDKTTEAYAHLRKQLLTTDYWALDVKFSALQYYRYEDRARDESVYKFEVGVDF